MNAEEIADKLIALKRYEITKYKSTINREVLEYREHEEFGRFILAADLYRIINELLTEPNHDNK